MTNMSALGRCALGAKKILIVSLKAGAGHLQAAAALEQAAKNKYPKAQIKNVDLADYATFLTKEFYNNFYLQVVKKTPKVYEWLYKNIPRNSSKARILSDRINTRPFKKLILDYQPDIIFCTHFVPADLVLHWRAKEKLSYRVIICLTDYEAHPIWVDNKTDLYTVATSEVKEELINFGAKKKKIRVCGIPIDPKFSRKIDQKKIRNKLKIKGIFTAAIFSGGFGLGPIAKIFKRIVALPLNVQVIVVTGHNNKLFIKLQKLAKKTKKRCKIYKFINNVEEITVAADIIISKPGGLTVSESLAMQTPLIIFNPIPGQEVANSHYLTRNLAALRADDVDEIIRSLKNIYANPSLLKELKKNAKYLARPNAANDILNIAMKI